MFGLALRSYQKKMNRLTESATARKQTLWEAVLDLVEAEQPTRTRVLERFRFDGEREVAAVLKDLVRTGLVFVTGAGDNALYGLTTEPMRDRIQRQDDRDAVVNLAWMKIFRQEATTRAALVASLPVDAPVVEEAIAELVSTGRVREEDGTLSSNKVVLPLGGDQGWEAAVLDHFRAVAVAVATKVRSGLGGAKASDRIGGSTFSFTIEPGHPFESEVYDLLRRCRLDAQSLWDRVSRHNEEHPPSDDRSVTVTFYVGQTLEQLDDDEPPAADGAGKEQT
jgi:hypothetical protein